MRTQRKFWAISKPKASTEGKREADMHIDGSIIDGIPFTEGDTSSQQFRKDLQALGTIDKLTVHINSLGGSLQSAIAIYHLLLESPAEKVARISAVAASAATIIAAACTIEMYPGSMQLIHCCADYPSDYMNADDHQAAAEDLRTWDDSMVTIYAAKTGKPASEIRAQMATNAWMSAEQCLEFGLCDTILPGTAVTASFDRALPHLWKVGNRVMDFTGFTALPTAMLSKQEHSDFEYQRIVAMARANTQRGRI